MASGLSLCGATHGCEDTTIAHSQGEVAGWARFMSDIGGLVPEVEPLQENTAFKRFMERAGSSFGGVPSGVRLVRDESKPRALLALFDQVSLHPLGEPLYGSRLHRAFTLR